MRFLTWLVTDSSGRIVVAQWPNPALWVWFAATVAQWVSATEVGRGVAAGALLVWAADEIARGASPFRRLLGMLVLGWQLFGLAR